MKILFFILLSSLSLVAFAEYSIDQKETIKGIVLSSGKKDAHRSYLGKLTKELPYSLNLVKAAILLFSERCNNEYKDRRKFSDKKLNCKYHNDHLVETFTVSNIRSQDYFKDLSAFFLLGRKIYNRGEFGYYELVTVRDSVNAKKQKNSIIIARMLDDEEVKYFTSPKFKKESAFDKSTSYFELTELAPDKTQLVYEYSAETDHWLLNKKVAAGKVFNSIANSIQTLVESIETEALTQKKALSEKQE